MVRRERNKEKHHEIRWTRSETESVGNTDTELYHVHILCTRSADP